MPVGSGVVQWGPVGYLVKPHKDGSVSITKISEVISVQLFILDTVKLAVIQQQSVLNEECDILGGQNIL